MSPAACYLLILWMTFVSYSTMSLTRSPYVSEFEYVPWLHPSRNPDCPARFAGDRKILDEFEEWDRPSIEVKAVLSRCSKFAEERYDEDQDRGRITDCTRKIVISLRFNNVGKTDTAEKFLAIDHVLDSLTMKRIPLQHPYLIKVRQELILQMYGLKFQSRVSSLVVNAEAREEVINNQSSNFTGCSVDSDKPTCGQMYKQGQPVPFSRGFCCSCDPRINGRRRIGGSNATFGSSRRGAKSNYKDATNKPRNRFRLENGHASLDDDSVAQRQTHRTSARSGKKSNASLANLIAIQTVGAIGSLVPDARREKAEQSKRIDDGSRKKSSENEETRSLGKLLEPVKSEPSNFGAKNSGHREKCSREQVETSSTAVTGKTPNCANLTRLYVDIGQNQSLGRKNESLEKKNVGTIGSKREEMLTVEEDSKRGGLNAKQKSDFTGEAMRNRNEAAPERIEERNHGFHSVDSKADAKKLSRGEEEGASRSRSQNINELSSDWPNSSGSADAVRSTKYASVRKLATERWPKEINAGNGKKKLESFYGNKGSSIESANGRSKVFTVTSAIDSRGIRPSMHLNESPRNLSTGVLNSNRSPSKQAPRTSDTGEGNLNRVMENTSPSWKITVGTFNEKYGADGAGYFQASGKEAGEVADETFEKDNATVPSKIIGKEGSSRGKNDLYSCGKKHSNKGSRKNYTPQKRTLKELSYRNIYDPRDKKTAWQNGVTGCGSEENIRRSRRQIRNGKHWRISRSRSSGLNNAFPRRGRRKRNEKANGDEETRQVYIDVARNLRSHASDRPRSSKLARDSANDKEAEAMAAREKAKSAEQSDLVSQKEASREDNVDKQIEEKFSRISDALKEDTGASKGEEKLGEIAGTNEGEEISSDDARMKSKFEETDDSPSRQSSNGILNANDAAVAVLDEKMDNANREGSSYLSEHAGIGEQMEASQQSSPSSNEIFSDYKSSISGSELAISPTEGSPIVGDQNLATSSFLDDEPENLVNDQPLGSLNLDSLEITASTVTETNESTQAVIVVDLFKIPSATASKPVQTTTPKKDTKLLDKLGTLKKSIEKAFGQLKPVHQTLNATESTTMMLEESTGTNTVTEDSTGTTMITDRTFRPLQKLEGKAKQTSGGGAEFENEVIIDEVTFPDETSALTVSAPTTKKKSGSVQKSRPKRKTPRIDRRRKKKRALSVTGRRNLRAIDKRETDRCPCVGNPGTRGRSCATRTDPAVKFSFEAGNVNVVKERLGAVRSFSTEQRNYLRLRVNDRDKRKRRVRHRHAPRKHGKIWLNVIKTEDGDRRDVSDRGGKEETGPEKKYSSFVTNWTHHPWFTMTESPKLADFHNDHTERILSDENKEKKSDARSREISTSSVTDDVLGRILPPCGKKSYHGSEGPGTRSVICQAEANHRGRRLLSVSRLKDGKNDHGPSKGRKKVQNDENNFIKDESDVDYEEEASEHRKRPKSVRDKSREKSKKRDTTRLKRKKEKEGHGKKHLVPSSQEFSEDYDNFVPQEQDDEENSDGTFIEDGESDSDNNLEDSPENYNSLRMQGEHPGNRMNLRISKDVQNDDSYDQSIDDFDSANSFDKYPDDFNAGNEVLSMDKSENGDARSANSGQLGKDFEISLTGKIHLESDSNGRPVSISFNGAPEYFKQDSIDDGKTSEYVNRFPLESANSFVDAPGTLDSAGTDSANFLPNVFDNVPALNSPLRTLHDRSIAREYLLHAIRARSRNAANYKGGAIPRQKFLRLQKKSVGTNRKPETKQESEVQVNGGFEKSLKRFKKESVSSDILPGETELKKYEKSSAAEQNEFPNVEDQSSPSLDFDDSLQNTKDEQSVNDLAPISLDLANLPESSFANVDAATNGEVVGCFDMNFTTEQIELQETTMSPKYLGALRKTTLLSLRDLVSSPSNSTGTETVEPTEGTTISDTTTSATTTKGTTTTTVATTTITNSRNETVIEAKMSFPKPVAHVPKSIPSYNNSQEDMKESAEKKNMLAISEFVKKLEKLVSDSGNSSNATQRTLIHLKKFIIVPDNRTLWSLKEYAAPENLQQLSSTETVVVLGEEGRNRTTKKSVNGNEESEYLEGDDDEISGSSDSDLIKEIIGSVIAGNSKHAAMEKSDKLGDNPEPLEDQSGNLEAVDESMERANVDSTEREEAGTNLEEEKKIEDLGKGGAGVQRVRKNVDDQFIESNLEKQKDTNTCAESESNANGSNEAGSLTQKTKRENRGRKKDAKHLKKRRRRKRIRKLKKRKRNRGKKNDRKGKKNKSPFKRNLLMLPEVEGTRSSNVDYEMKREGRVKLPGHGGTKGKLRSAKSASKTKFKERQIRGGQDCSDPRHPRNVDPFKYLESAHCLRFSDLWYSVYQLEEPIVVHNVHLQLYVKQTLSNGSVAWEDLMGGSSARLGTFDEYYRNREKTVAFAYRNVKGKFNSESNLDPARDRLLVPSRSAGKSSKYSEAEEWPSEYLVVQADKINEDANECDKAGVGFTAFVAQPDRCGRVSGTCLKNQPLRYWRHDVEARESGRAGCYFLSNFARVPSEAIKYNVNGTGSREFLALEYHSPHVSVIDVEVRDDYNAFLKAGSPGRIVEVYTDNTAIDYTVITALITNKGSSPSPYRARITDCPKGLPASWSNTESDTKTIPPHRDRKVAVELYGRVSLNEFSCSVLLLNGNNEPIAKRNIKVRRLGYCFCVQYCVCSCINDNETDCQPMSLENYHSVGFRGLGAATSIESWNWTDFLTVVTIVLAILSLFLLVLGFLKGTIGLCVPTVSRWGLDDLLVRNRMAEYYERDLKLKSLVFNHAEEPVHPETGRKSVRICSRKLAFFLNLIFFYIYPLVICCLFCKRPQQQTSPSSSRRSKTSLTFEENESYEMIRVATYGDSVNSKMEEEDTKYVLDELKKSQESLQNRNRHKSDQTLREETSSD